MVVERSEDLAGPTVRANAFHLLADFAGQHSLSP
jgi:hypothetical protein